MTLINDTGWKLGQRMRVARQAAGLEQLDMCPIVSASRATISAWENAYREPSFSQVVRWASATGQSLEWLAEGVMNDEAPAVAGASHLVRPEGFEPPTV